MSQIVTALLGRKDEPTDAVEEYCRYLAAALQSRHPIGNSPRALGNSRLAGIAECAQTYGCAVARRLGTRAIYRSGLVVCEGCPRKYLA